MKCVENEKVRLEDPGIKVQLFDKLFRVLDDIFDDILRLVRNFFVRGGEEPALDRIARPLRPIAPVPSRPSAPTHFIA